MAAGKRSRAATKGLKPKKSITGAQRKARKLNIEKARRQKKKGGKRWTGSAAEWQAKQRSESRKAKRPGTRAHAEASHVIKSPSQRKRMIRGAWKQIKARSN